MNVHVSYKVPKSPEIESQIEHYIAKLRKRLQTYQPELVHLHVTIDENSPRTGFAVSLNLRLPSGQIAAQEQGSNLEGVIKGAFEDLLEQVAKHKDHLRSQYKWPRRRRVGRTRPQPQVPFEETIAAVHPEMATGQDITSWINANLRRLERFVDRELRFRFNSGELPRETITREEVIDEVVATALAEGNHKPERLGLEPWLFRLARRTIDSVDRQNRDRVETLPLEASMRQQNVHGTDDEQLQYHQPGETMTRESVTRDPRLATPEDIAASEEMINMVELALLGSSREERDAFILFAVEGFTVDEISAISDLNPEQVRDAIKRARERLRKTVTGPNEFKDHLLQHSKTALPNQRRSVLMITREALHRLAEFQTDDDSAISFYFQPTTPSDKSHREEAILIKDIVKSAQQRAQARKNGRGGPSADDLDRLLALADRLDGNHSRAKAIFACAHKGVWQEFDFPAELQRTEIIVNRRFHLRPLVAIVDALPRTLAALTDRKRARLFDVWMHEARQIEDISNDLPRRGRSDGFAGYDAGHAERHVGNEAMRHVKQLVERLLERQKNGEFNHLAIGCRDEIWSDIDSQLHPYLRQAFVGRFNRDVATGTPEQICEDVEALLAESTASYQQGLVREVLGEAQRNARGAVGLRRVLEALERGEVQALLVGDSLRAAATECGSCGHLDTRTTPQCDVCGNPTREVEDVADALIGLALRNAAELVHVSGDPEFERAGNVAALLRFRADQNTPAKVAS